LELGASVGFIHKESITMHGHTILKFHDPCRSKYSGRDRVTADMTDVHNVQLPNFDISPEFTIKLRRKGWVGPVACMRQNIAYRVSVRRLEGKRPLGRLGVKGGFK
jgi:hypothetical protein